MGVMVAIDSTHLTYTETRSGLKNVLTRAEQGVPVGVRHRDHTVAFVEVKSLLDLLRNSSQVPRPMAVPEADGWSVFLPGVPVAADAASYDDAVAEFIDALREYAEDWSDRLRVAPGHTGNWALTQLVDYSDDAALRDWVSGTTA